MASLASHSGLTARPTPLAGLPSHGRFLPDSAGALVAPALFRACLDNLTLCFPARSSRRLARQIGADVRQDVDRNRSERQPTIAHLPVSAVVSPSTTEGFEPCANGVCFFVNRTGHAS